MVAVILVVVVIVLINHRCICSLSCMRFCRQSMCVHVCISMHVCDAVLGLALLCICHHQHSVLLGKHCLALLIISLRS